jgi:hypothetical protein
MIRKILYKAFAALGAKEVRAYESASLNCQQAQLERLKEIIEPNIETIYGRSHGFEKIKTAKDFQQAVPINTYDHLSPYIDRMTRGEPNVLTAAAPFMFAITSGTSGARKFIPINPAYMAEFRRASTVSGYNMLKNYPRLPRGLTLSIFSPAEEGRTEGGLPYGAISGRLYLDEPKFIKKFVSPLPYELFLIKDYEARYFTILRCALMLPISCIYTLNPSTIALLGKRLKIYGSALVEDIANGTLNPPGEVTAETRKVLAPFLKPNKKRAAQLQMLLEKNQLRADSAWPELTLISCWTKAAAAFYLQDFPELFGDTPICDITYGASEGRGTVCLAPDKQGLSINSHFFEFVEESEIDKENPHVLLGHELTVGTSYYILFTTSAGLYRYNINDIVKVVGFHNTVPLLEFLHKGGNISSFTGEKLTESHVTSAVKMMAKKMGFTVNFFTVIPEFRPEPHYNLLMEGAPDISAAFLEKSAAVLDECLSECNTEYGAKRESKRLSAPNVMPLEPGSYEHMRKYLVGKGVPDAQIKISHLNPKADIKELLEPRIVRSGVVV